MPSLLPTHTHTHTHTHFNYVKSTNLNRYLRDESGFNKCLLCNARHEAVFICSYLLFSACRLFGYFLSISGPEEGKFRLKGGRGREDGGGEGGGGGSGGGAMVGGEGGQGWEEGDGGQGWEEREGESNGSGSGSRH